MDRLTALNGGNIGEMIISALQRYPERIAFVDGSREVRYDEVTRRVSQLIQTFTSLGLQRGDTIAQLAINRPETFFVVAAAYISGMRSVTLHGMAGEEDHAYVINDCEAKIAIVDPYFHDRGNALRTRVPNIKHWYAHNDSPGWENLWSLADQFSAQELKLDSEPDDIIRLAYTGGTTGKPKGVMLSNRAMATNMVLALAGMDWPAPIRYLCPAPISHGGGSQVVPTLMRGGCVVLQHGFNVDRFIDAYESQKCNTTWLVPTMIYALLDHPRTRSVDWSGMEMLIYSAAPMVPSRIREALNVFGPCLVQSYGQSESPNTILTLSRSDHIGADDKRLAAAGKPYPMMQVALLDDNCCEVPEGEPGEICVRGPLLMSGYWKQPEQTEQVFKGNWLHTGDIARRDAQGYFYIVDRKKDMIISGGFNVYPKEVEDVIAADPAVAAVAVIGVPDAKWGEAVKAVVKIKAGMEIDEAQLIERVRVAKGTVHAPKSVDFLDELPMTALGKIDKKALRVRYV